MGWGQSDRLTMRPSERRDLSRLRELAVAPCVGDLGVRPTPTAGLYEVFYAHQTLGRFDVSQTPRGSPEVLNIHRVLRE